MHHLSRCKSHYNHVPFYLSSSFCKIMCFCKFSTKCQTIITKQPLTRLDFTDFLGVKHVSTKYDNRRYSHFCIEFPMLCILVTKDFYPQFCWKVGDIWNYLKMHPDRMKDISFFFRISSKPLMIWEMSTLIWKMSLNLTSSTIIFIRQKPYRPATNFFSNV